AAVVAARRAIGDAGRVVVDGRRVVGRRVAVLGAEARGGEAGGRRLPGDGHDGRRREEGEAGRREAPGEVVSACGGHGFQLSSTGRVAGGREGGPRELPCACETPGPTRGAQPSRREGRLATDLPHGPSTY